MLEKLILIKFLFFLFMILHLQVVELISLSRPFYHEISIHKELGNTIYSWSCDVTEANISTVR